MKTASPMVKRVSAPRGETLEPECLLRRLVLLLSSCLALWLPGRPPAANEPGLNQDIQPSAQATGNLSTLTLQLPVVARPETAKPAIGLPTDAHLDRTPVRQTKGLDLVKMGWTYNCMECHKLFPAKWHYARPLAEHQEINLQHGENRFCLNCHHPTNRNAFVDYDGSEIAQQEVVLLCAKCHGTIYRDWKAGAHGRQNGFWKAGFGEKTKLRCIQCHDPHQPQFQPVKPLAPLKYPVRAANPPAHNSAPARHE